MKTFANKGLKCPRCGDPMPITRIPLTMVTGGTEQWPMLCGCKQRDRDRPATPLEVDSVIHRTAKRGGWNK